MHSKEQMKLLTVDNYKTRKGEDAGYLTAVLHLAPHTLSGSNVCPRASPGCSAACLNTAGKGVNPHIQQSRLRRTILYLKERERFYDEISDDLRALERKANREGMRPAVRLNATSDQPKMAIHMAENFPAIQFYDYTKIKEVFEWEWPRNYYPTFSRSETNWAECLEVLKMGGNVATVFAERPKFYQGYEVIDGDKSDLRFLDKRPAIVGLSAKGKGKKDQTGFVVRMKYAEMEKLISRAITERYCTFGQLSKFVQNATDETPAFDDIQDVLNGMVLEKKIAQTRSGPFTAYFDAKKIPSRFWLDGEGKVGMEFNGQPVTFVPKELKDVEEEPFRDYPTERTKIEKEFDTLSGNRPAKSDVQERIEEIQTAVSGEHVHEKSRKHGVDKNGGQRWLCECGKTFTERSETFIDGRLAPRAKQPKHKDPTDKQTRYVAKNRAEGKCTRCGKPSAPYVNCEECRAKKYTRRKNATLAIPKVLNGNLKQNSENGSTTISQKFEYTCDECGGPRSVGSASKCRECYQKKEEPMGTLKVVEQKIDEAKTEIAEFIGTERVHEMTVRLSEDQLRYYTVMSEWEKRSVADLLQDAIQSGIDVDKDLRAGDYWSDAGESLKNVLQNEGRYYSHTVLRREALLEHLLTLIKEWETHHTIGQIRDNLGRYFVSNALSQLKTKNTN